MQLRGAFTGDLVTMISSVILTALFSVGGPFQADTKTFASPAQDRSQASAAADSAAIRVLATNVAHLRFSIDSFRLTSHSKPLANWAQEVSAWSAVFTGLVTFMLTWALFRIRAQQDRDTNQAQSYLRLLDRMEAVRPARTALRDLIRTHQTHDERAVKNPDAYWLSVDLLGDLKVAETPGRPEPVRESLHRLSREFDILGFMDRRKLISTHLVDEFYVAPLTEMAPLFRAYIAQLRAPGGGGNHTHLWELEQFMRRTVDVMTQHPSNTRRDNWPTDARSVAS